MSEARFELVQAVAKEIFEGLNPHQRPLRPDEMLAAVGLVLSAIFNNMGPGVDRALTYEAFKRTLDGAVMGKKH